MSYGIIEYDDNGKPKCEICGKSFSRVIRHVVQKHGIDERTYKRQFGFDIGRGICSRDSAEKSRQKTLKNYDKCIGQNLIKDGSASRFKKGSVGRTKEQVSAQTKLMLKERLKQSYMVEAMKKTGTKLGKSGLGNKKRWGKKTNE